MEAIQRMKEERILFKDKINGMNNWRHRSNEWQQFNYESFTRFDALLDSCRPGPTWLKDDKIAEIVEGGIRFFDQSVYDLLSFCIMPNHVHVIFELGASVGSSESTIQRASQSLNVQEFCRDDSRYLVTKVLASLKKYTAIRANRILRRSGSFWQHESYDHVIRDDAELLRMIYYVLDNPVKSGFVKNWKDWRWTYCKPGLF